MGKKNKRWRKMMTKISGFTTTLGSTYTPRVPQPDDVTVKAVVRGLVQGVCFRSDTEDEAKRLRLSGYVLNLPDGSVEAVIQGDRPTVDKMIEWIHEGPLASCVTGVWFDWRPLVARQIPLIFKTIRWEDS